jgi:myo-inositol-1(or 4)-monophosphatase
LPAPDNAADTKVLADAVREAGDIARHFYGGAFKTWHKDGGDPVTEADIAIDEFLKQTLLAARPQYGWLSEETADDPVRLAHDRVFIVDPIDGTYGFVKHRPQFTIVAAVVENGRPVSGAIYNPITDEMFEATRHDGSWRNGRRSRVSPQVNLENVRLLMEKKLADSTKWQVPWPTSMTAETRASAAYRMALVSVGEFDATVSLSRKSDWDLAAGDLIVEEAGGRVSDRDGTPLLYNRAMPLHGSVICGGPALHQLLLSRLREYIPN